ncbi:acyltransferase [bacterium]|nr:acyltransferase [bacterium]
MSEKIEYKLGIDGLRAVAVLVVLLFHVNFEIFKGGFVGVDVFFVISGFLITRLIINEIETTGGFGFVNFYTRRARRLMPALFATLFVSFAIGAIFFSPIYLERLGISSALSTLSLANIFFWSESGYFDGDAIFKPLLHMWSLSVEEQFYFFWPAFLAIITFRHFKLAAPVAIFAITVASLWGNQVVLDGPPESIDLLPSSIAALFSEPEATVFFLTPFRIFEFGIGALLVWMPDRLTKTNFVREVFLLVGLAAVASAVFIFDETTVFPSFNALVPCIGTALALLGVDARYSGFLVRNKISVHLGTLSYSLYLVHWPLIVYFVYYTGDTLENNPQAKVLLLISAYFLALCSYRFVEKPLRYGHWLALLSPRKLALMLSAAAILIIFPGIHAWKTQGWLWRVDSLTSISPDQLEAAQAKRMKYVRSKGGCSIRHYLDNESHCNEASEIQILAFGNSHALDAYNVMYSAYGDDEDINITWFETSYGCGFQYNNSIVINTKDNALLRCSERAELLNSIDFVSNLDVVAFSAHKPLSWGAPLMRILEHMRSLNPDLKIIFFGAYIGIRPYLCADLINRHGTSEACKDPKYAKYFAYQEKDIILARKIAGNNFLYVDKIELFCAGGELNSCLVETDGEPAFYDGDHLSMSFAELLAERMRQEYKYQLIDLGLH